MPDVTFILDVPVNIAMKRLGDSLDRMESRGSEYFERVRTGFLAEAERWPDTVDVIDATKSEDDIESEIREVAIGYIARHSQDDHAV
jgi:dTMP kinase